MAALAQFPLKGHHGETVWGRKNIPKYMREAGHMMRFMMAVLEDVQSTNFEFKDWFQDAIMSEGSWVGAVIQGEGRVKVLCIDGEKYDLGTVERAAQRLWPTWGGYGEKDNT
eukprot:6194627-Alexandrium_andersonii.AAC.1